MAHGVGGTLDPRKSCNHATTKLVFCNQSCKAICLYFPKVDALSKIPIWPLQFDFQTERQVGGLAIFFVPLPFEIDRRPTCRPEEGLFRSNFPTQSTAEDLLCIQLL